MEAEVRTGYKYSRRMNTHTRNWILRDLSCKIEILRERIATEVTISYLGHNTILQFFTFCNTEGIVNRNILLLFLT